MAKARMIDTRFWSDSFIVALRPIERYLFLYLLSNEHTAICGIYELPMAVMARETGLKSSQLLEIINKFEGKVYYINGWIWLKNFVKNQSEVSETIKKGIKNSRDLVPKEVLKTIADIENGKGIYTLPIAPVLSEPESESLSESKPKQKLNTSPSAENLAFKGNYLSKFKAPPRIHSSKDLIATEIWEWTGKKMAYPLIRKLVNKYGEQYCREVFSEAKQEEPKDRAAWFMWKVHQVKIQTTA